jgi:hypothetical protein
MATCRYCETTIYAPQRKFCSTDHKDRWHNSQGRDIPERKIEAYLVKRVEALGGEVRKVAWIGRRGAPDRLVMMPQQCVGIEWPSGIVHASLNTIWVELKAPGKKPEPHQAREHKRMRKMGQRVEVIDSIEGVDSLLGVG